MKNASFFASLKTFLLFLFSFLFLGNTMAQKPGKKAQYTTRSSAAIRHFEKAQELYDRKQDDAAMGEWMQAIEADSGFVEAHIMLAGMYADASDHAHAVREYKKAIALQPDFFPNIYYSVALSELEIGSYEGAYQDFQHYLTFPTKNTSLITKVKKYLVISDFGREAVKHPVPFELTNMGEHINTNDGEYSPAITADERFLFFTRLIGSGPRQEDIYMSEKVQGEWQPAINLGAPVNTDRNEGTVNIAPDGQTLYFAASGRNDGFGQMDIYRVTRTGGRWSEPRNLGPAINTPYYEGQPSIASDGRTLYFTSNRQGGLGQADLWMTYLKENGEWTAPVNLGRPINTEGIEQSPFIHPDNGTLYFSSDGHPGMGHTDFFYSRKNNKGAWDVPVNLGYPINTNAEERNIIVNAKGDRAFISSDRKKSKDDYDLYSFPLYAGARPTKVSYLKGKVFDKVTKQMMQARFEVIDLQSGIKVTESFSDKVSGEFLVCLPTDKNYALNVSSSGYLFYSDHFELKGDTTMADDAFQKDVPMIPIKVGERVVLNNVFFETGSAALRDESLAELDKLVAFLNTNVTLRIEIAGHTDNAGDAKVNQLLSESRAKAVFEYLIKQQVSAARLSYKGYGESKPIDDNNTELGRSKNRRTEFQIIL